MNNNNDKLNNHIIVTVIIIYYYYRGTISKYAQVNININKDFALQHTCCLRSEMKK